MNVTMRLTLDGLVRALRAKAHGLAEETERDYRRPLRRGANRLDTTDLRPIRYPSEERADERAGD